MLALRRNEDGLIYAFAEYRIVDKDAKDIEDGEYVYIRECWVHPKYRKIELLKEMMENEHKKYPKVKWVYYKRSKHGGRMKIFDIRGFYGR